MKHQPKTLHLHIPKHARAAAAHIAKGAPIVTDYGSTFGTAFIPQIREKVARLRKETTPLQTVSIVATYSQTIAWIETSKLHPHLRQKIQNHALKFLEHIAFLRLPANSHALSDLGPNYVNTDNEFQSFIVAESDPLLAALISLGHPPFYAIRSSNLTGEPEEFTIAGALNYAAKIKSPILAVTNSHLKDTRKRTGSQPILHLPADTKSPRVILSRMGNTHPQALEIIIKYLFPQARFHQHEEKQVTYRRQYHPRNDGIALEAIAIRQALLSASGLIR